MTYWIGVLLATIGASLILGALTFVSALIGVLVNAMIVLMCGPTHRPRPRQARARVRPVRRRSVLVRAAGASGVVAERSGGLVVDLETSQQLPQSPHLHLKPTAPARHGGHDACRVGDAGAG